MNLRITTLFLLGFFCSITKASDSTATLFIYDNLDKNSSFYITAFRDAFKAENRLFEECAVESTKVDDLSKYGTIVIYSRVMAFDKKSPVRAWILTQKSLFGQKIHLFATANRWFLDKHFVKMNELIKERKGTIVDAVSAATKEMTDEAKRKQVAAFVGKIGSQ